MAIARDPARDHLREVAARLEAARHGEKGSILEEAQAFYGWSRAKLYAELERQAGWSSGRAVRADKGSSRVSADSLNFVAALQKGSIRANGKQTMHTPVSAGVALANGHEIEVGASQLNRLMRGRRLAPRQHQEASAPTEMRYPHPNYCHQADFSLCVVYYLNGKQGIMEDDQFYKNKLDGLAKIKFKVWRCTLVDPCSGLIQVWYQEAAGENARMLFEFLMWAWGIQPGRRFHGVPVKFLQLDLGPGNTSTPIANLARALEFDLLFHAPRNARAHGAVEGAQNITETQFECRLRFDPMGSVPELNAAAVAWSEAYNADCIPGQDTRLRRRGLPAPIARYDLWLRIREEQLRLLPPVEVCQAFLEGREETRKVSRRLEISYRHPQAERPRVYDVGGLAGVCAGDRVEIAPLLIGDCAIRITVPRFDGAPLTYRLEAVADDYDGFGFRLSSPVPGMDYARRPDSDADRTAKALDQILYPGQDAKTARAKNVTPMGGAVDAVRHLAQIDIPAALARRGTEIALQAQRFEIEKLPASVAARRLHGEGVKLDGLYDWLRERYPDGVPEDELPKIAELLRGADHAGLRAVGGV